MSFQEGRPVASGVTGVDAKAGTRMTATSAIEIIRCLSEGASRLAAVSGRT
jgi:hypothetical protein